MPHMAVSTPLLITFSGLDGSGKSTQIESLRTALQGAGIETRLLTFWDDVVVGVKYREGFVHKVYKSEHGVGSPGKPVNRRDKNVRRWYLTLARHFLYLLDAMHLSHVISRERAAARKPSVSATGEERKPVVSARENVSENARSSARVIILDRYIYDELANLRLSNPLSRSFVGMVQNLVPRPDIAFLLDADPAAAHARKPEYPVEFMKQCRRAYFDLASQLGTMTIIPALGIKDAGIAVLKAAEQRLAAAGCTVDLVSGKVSAA